MLGLRERFVRDWPGPALRPGGRSALPAGLAPGGSGVRGADRSDRAARAGGAGLLRSVDRRPGPARHASARTRDRRRAPHGRRGPDPAHAVGQLAHGSRALPEAVLLDARTAAAPLQRTGGAHRHRDPPVDRAPRLGPGSPARGRRRRRPHPGGARRGSGQDGPAAAGVPDSRATPTGRRCSQSARSCCGSAGSRSAAASTRSTASPTDRGRSSTGRPASARPTRCSSSCTGWRASRSGTRRPRT